MQSESTEEFQCKGCSLVTMSKFQIFYLSWTSGHQMVSTIE